MEPNNSLGALVILSLFSEELWSCMPFSDAISFSHSLFLFDVFKNLWAFILESFVRCFSDTLLA